MSAPAAYDEYTLGEYILTMLGANVTGTLGWTLVSTVEIVTDTLLAYDVTDIAQATDILKLRAIARREAWRAVMEQTVAHYDLTMPDGIRAERNQIHLQATAAYREARKAALRYGSDYQVTTTRTRHADDPFAIREGVETA